MGKDIIGESQTVKIDRSSPFDLAKFIIGDGWTIAEEDEQARNFSEVDLTKVRLVSMLKSGEVSVQGEERLERLKQAGHIRPDAKFLQTLCKNKHLIPASWKEKIGGHTRYIFFDGTILRYLDGNRYALSLYWEGGIWFWDYHWLGHSCYINSISAVLLAT